jgi:NADPH:quinone reductase-like Zn-dependent oxidoreductase
MAKPTILGQDPAVLVALWANVVSWFLQSFFPAYLPKLLPLIQEEDTEQTYQGAVDLRTKCIVIGRPGGKEQLRLITLKPGRVTLGYNVPGGAFCTTIPIVNDDDIPPDCVILKVEAFSINYADICIRWGLYESAKQYVGYPISPGFDVAGVVERVGSNCKEQWRKGDRAFGCSLFGAYSTRVMVPAAQLRKLPKNMTMQQGACLPAVSLTALYALFLAGHFPTKSQFKNKAILIHSAAGGVGSMLIQMAKLLGFSPIVGVVGSTAKVQTAKALGCDVVIDKSVENLWDVAEIASPNGYATIMDANGVSTLGESYEHLAMTGRLIVFGFHTNLPMGSDMLSPIEWIRMAWKANRMPKFDPMEMGAKNKAVLAFNLSFFAEEREMLAELFDKVYEWIEQGKLQCPRIETFTMNRIQEAHDLIQSGKSVGKIVITTDG